MGLMYVPVKIRNLGSRRPSYQADFLIDTGAMDSMAPGAKLREIGFKPVGVERYQLADGRMCEFPFILAEITFMGKITAGRVILGPDDVEPLLGVTALESAGIVLDPVKGELRRLPAISLR